MQCRSWAGPCRVRWISTLILMQASLLASIDGMSDEQKTGVKFFNSFTHVYRLTIQMRFTDEILKSILNKVRHPGGCELTRQEWAALENTETTRRANEDRACVSFGSVVY